MNLQQRLDYLKDLTHILLSLKSELPEFAVEELKKVIIDLIPDSKNDVTQEADQSAGPHYMIATGEQAKDNELIEQGWTIVTPHDLEIINS